MRPGARVPSRVLLHRPVQPSGSSGLPGRGPGFALAGGSSGCSASRGSRLPSQGGGRVPVSGCLPGPGSRRLVHAPRGACSTRVRHFGICKTPSCLSWRSAQSPSPSVRLRESSSRDQSGPPAWCLVRPWRVVLVRRFWCCPLAVQPVSTSGPCAIGSPRRRVPLGHGELPSDVSRKGDWVAQRLRLN